MPAMEETVIVHEDSLPQKKAYKLTMRAHKAYRLIFFVMGVIQALLAIRFFFKLAGANPLSSFVAFIYGLTGILLWPFSSVFPRNTAAGAGVGRVFEPSTLVACIIYVLIAWGVSRLLLISCSRPVEER
jgi:hypothetical protein